MDFTRQMSILRYAWLQLLTASLFLRSVGMSSCAGESRNNYDTIDISSKYKGVRQ